MSGDSLLLIKTLGGILSLSSELNVLENQSVLEREMEERGVEGEDVRASERLLTHEAINISH